MAVENPSPPPLNDPTPKPDRAAAVTQSMVRLARSSAFKFRAFGSHALAATRTRVKRLQAQRNLDATRFELTERVYRDAGMHIMADGLEVPGQEALHETIASKKAMCEMLQRAVTAGDKARKSELALLAKELTDLQETLGERALQMDFEFPERSRFLQRREELLKRISDGEAQVAELDRQLGAETSRRKLSFRIVVGVALLCVLLVAGSIASTLLRPSTHFTGIAARNHLEHGLGFVVCGYDVEEALGKRVDSEVPVSSGSAFVITHDGYFLTNKHVVEETFDLLKHPLDFKNMQLANQWKGTPCVWVFVDGKKYRAQISHVSDKYDLAILKVDARFDRFFCLSAKSDAPRSEDVWAAGFPGVAQIALSDAEDQLRRVAEYDAKTIENYYQPRDFEFVMTRGTVSRTTHDEAADCWWIQHNADINPGNSGGPLLATDSTVVGMNTLGITGGASGTFYALQLSQARSEIDHVAKHVQWR